jgi:hypothetical protein
MQTQMQVQVSRQGGKKRKEKKRSEKTRQLMSHERERLPSGNQHAPVLEVARGGVAT